MKHRYELTVPSYLCRRDDAVHIDGLAAIMGEAAWLHARTLGVAFTEESAVHYWILRRLGVRVLRPPRWGDEIVVETWPSRVERILAMREFLLSTREGEVLVEASSAWVILDATSRRPVRPERLLSPEWRVPDVALEIPTGKLPGIEQARAEEILEDATWYPVRESDIDRNEHVNNARYAQWIADAITTRPSDSRVQTLTYLAETHRGDEYAVVSHNGCVEVWSKSRDSLDDLRVSCRMHVLA